MLLSDQLEEARSGSGYRTLYYIGNRPAKPKPRSISALSGRGQPEPEWVRPWLDNPVQRAVFLSPNPMTVANNHGIAGHVYAYKVPRWVIKEAGGLNRYDKATEIIIPDVLWKHVKFIGKSMDKKEFASRLLKSQNERGFEAAGQGREIGSQRGKSEAI